MWLWNGQQADMTRPETAAHARGRRTVSSKDALQGIGLDLRELSNLDSGMPAAAGRSCHNKGAETIRFQNMV